MIEANLPAWIVPEAEVEVSVAHAGFGVLQSVRARDRVAQVIDLRCRNLVMEK